jgi:pyridoxine 4-dehydrogenase
MADAVQAGKIGATGLSNVTLTELDRATKLGINVTCVQNHYALTFRKDEALVQACAERGIAFTPFFRWTSARSPRTTSSPRSPPGWEPRRRRSASRGCSPMRRTCS